MGRVDVLCPVAAVVVIIITVAAAAPATPVLTPSASLSNGWAASVFATFSTPVSGLNASAFHITPTNGLAVENAIVHGNGTNWTLHINFTGPVPACPADFRAFHAPRTALGFECLRLVTALAPWSDQQRACEPYNLASVLHPGMVASVYAQFPVGTVWHW